MDREHEAMLVCRAWGLLLLPVLLLWTSGSYTLCICVELSVKASINNMGLYVDRPPHSCWLTMCFLDKGVIVYVELLSFTVKRQHFESHETLQVIWMHHTDSWMWNKMVLFVCVAWIVADVSDVVQPRASAGVGPSVSLGLDASVSRRLFCLIAVYTHVRHRNRNRLLHSADALKRLQMNAYVAQCRPKCVN